MIETRRPKNGSQSSGGAPFDGGLTGGWTTSRRLNPRSANPPRLRHSPFGMPQTLHSLCTKCNAWDGRPRCPCLTHRAEFTKMQDLPGVQVRHSPAPRRGGTRRDPRHQPHEDGHPPRTQRTRRQRQDRRHRARNEPHRTTDPLNPAPSPLGPRTRRLRLQRSRRGRRTRNLDHPRRPHQRRPPRPDGQVDPRRLRPSTPNAYMPACPHPPLPACPHVRVRCEQVGGRPAPRTEFPSPLNWSWGMPHDGGGQARRR